MKNLTSTMGVFALVIGAVAAMAMSPAPKKAAVKSSATNYHWFRLSDGTYLGYDSDVNKQTECGSPQVNCVRGAEGIDEDQNPTGNQFIMLGTEQL